MAQDVQRPPVRHARHANRSDARHGKRSIGPKQSIASKHTEDEATVAYIRRILCRTSSGPDATPGSAAVEGNTLSPLEEFLPPLTSSNTVDVELYALIAVILDNLVQSWYSRITSDTDFVSEVVQIIAHCTRGLEQRLRLIDLESLLLDELPDLAARHVDAVRTARMSRGGPLSSQEQRFRLHVLNPHMALHPTPEDAATLSMQQENEDAWCLLLVHRILPLLLPPEDLQNSSLNVLVSEILAEIVFRGGICGKACQGWLWWEGITNIIAAIQEANAAVGTSTTPSLPSPPANRLDHYGLLSASSAKPLTSEHPRRRWRGRFDSITAAFWSLLQLTVLVWALLRSFVIAVTQAQSLPLRTRRSHGVKAADRTEKAATESGDSSTPPHSNHYTRPIVGMTIWGCIARITELDKRMPWFTGALSLLQWLSLHAPGQLCCANSRLDRLLSSALHQRVLNNATLIPNVLRAARSALFPRNTLAPSRALPLGDDEIARIRAECARAIVDAMPDPVRMRFFATRDIAVMRADVATNCLDLFADPYVNEHLIVDVVELLAVRLFPELLRNDTIA